VGDEEENDDEDVEDVYEDVEEVDSKDEDVVKIEEELKNCDEVAVVTVEFKKVGALLALEIKAVELEVTTNEVKLVEGVDVEVTVP